MISAQESIEFEGFSHHQPLPPGTFILHSQVFTYPSLARRYKAMAIDILFLLFIMVVAMVLLGENENRPTIMIVLAIVISFYEPLLTTYAAATFGQRLLGIRVRDYNRPSRPARIWQTYTRLWIKVFLGWLSFLTIHNNREHRAILDIASSTVVIMKD